MRFLTLMRHAKSDWGEPNLDDHDRPLNGRGNRAAPAVAKVLADKYFGVGPHGIPKPDCIVSSTAARARATAGFLAAALKFREEDIDLEPSLYDATSGDILELVKNLPEEFEHAVLVGHNPGMQSCAEFLLGSEIEVQEIGNLVTCGTVMIRLSVDFWALADAGAGELIDYVHPNLIGVT